ncbi:MAG: hypothetical protein JXB45_06895 [Candidatus Krumholzibacteriota bacterium]|nr:hypothetical protein [Candidatus Krumholzibacteriota bacterium]
MKSRYVLTLFLMVMLVSPLFFSAANAQLLGILTLQRLSTLDRLGTGARTMGLGFAFTAVSDDAFALLYNPAGLSQIGKKELTFGIHHSQLDRSDSYRGNLAETSDSHTSLGHIALIYPYPTYRGSLVLGGGVFRVGNSDVEYIRSAYRSDLDGTVTNMFVQAGSIFQYRFGFGMDLSPRLSVGANCVIWNENIEYTEDLSYRGIQDSSYVFTDNVSADLDGISLEFGLLMKFTENLKAGLMFSTPTWLSFSGEAIEDYAWTERNGTAWTLDDPWLYTVDDEYTLPMSFRGGLAFQLENLLLAADASYTDYSQTKYNGIKLYNEYNRGAEVLEPTWNFHLGSEISFPWYPIRVRGGYSYMPIQFVGTEELAYVWEEDPELILNGDWEDYSVRDKRQYYNVGFGCLIDRVLTLDFGLAYGKFERRTLHLSEKFKVTEVTVSGSYRF